MGGGGVKLNIKSPQLQRFTNPVSQNPPKLKKHSSSSFPCHHILRGHLTTNINKTPEDLLFWPKEPTFIYNNQHFITSISPYCMRALTASMYICFNIMITVTWFIMQNFNYLRTSKNTLFITAQGNPSILTLWNDT